MDEAEEVEVPLPVEKLSSDPNRDGERRGVVLVANGSFSPRPTWTYAYLVRTICKDFGIICIRREGKDIQNLISSSEVLQECKDNIISVDEIVPNQISSSRVRECMRRRLSIKYLTCDEVIEYIRERKLFMEAKDNDTTS